MHSSGSKSWNSARWRRVMSSQNRDATSRSAWSLVTFRSSAHLLPLDAPRRRRALHARVQEPERILLREDAHRAALAAIGVFAAREFAESFSLRDTAGYPGGALHGRSRCVTS